MISSSPLDVFVTSKYLASYHDESERVWCKHPSVVNFHWCRWGLYCRVGIHLLPIDGTRYLLICCFDLTMYSSGSRVRVKFGSCGWWNLILYCLRNISICASIGRMVASTYKCSSCVIRWYPVFVVSCARWREVQCVSLSWGVKIGAVLFVIALPPMVSYVFVPHELPANDFIVHCF